LIQTPFCDSYISIIFDITGNKAGTISSATIYKFYEALLVSMKRLANRGRDNLKIFKTQDSGTDRTNKVQFQEKLEENVKYLMQEASLLTSQEADVARLICDGLIEREIVERLGLSHHKVKDNLKIIYAEFWVHARAQLVSSMFQ
jgi:DNA-binding CsgD family transcriptional regulator